MNLRIYSNKFSLSATAPSICPTNPAFHYRSLPLHLTQLSAFLSKGWSESNFFPKKKTYDISQVRLFLLAEFQSCKALVELSSLSHIIYIVPFTSILSYISQVVQDFSHHLFLITGSKQAVLIILPSETGLLDVDHLKKSMRYPSLND